MQTQRMLLDHSNVVLAEQIENLIRTWLSDPRDKSFTPEETKKFFDVVDLIVIVEDSCVYLEGSTLYVGVFSDGKMLFSEIWRIIRIEYRQRFPEARSGCYIATACYGDYNCQQVLTFRSFRDNYLSQTVIGRIFIKAYYIISPTIAKWLKNKRRINGFIRNYILEPIYLHLIKIFDKH